MGAQVRLSEVSRRGFVGSRLGGYLYQSGMTGDTVDAMTSESAILDKQYMTILRSPPIQRAL